MNHGTDNSAPTPARRAWLGRSGREWKVWRIKFLAVFLGPVARSGGAPPSHRRRDDL